MCYTDETGEIALNDMIGKALEERLSDILRVALDGSSGDIAPEQVMEWEKLKERFTTLMVAIVMQNKMKKHKVDCPKGEEFCLKCGLSFENSVHNIKIETPNGIVTVTPYDKKYEHFCKIYGVK